jgi:beta-glucosidase
LGQILAPARQVERVKQENNNMGTKSICQAAALLSLATASAAQPGADLAWSDKNIDHLLSQMSLEEKATLTSGRDAWSTQPIDRLDIPYIWMADGPHGLRRAPSTDTWGYGDQLPATCFPTASALSATWDVDLVSEVGVLSDRFRTICHLGR